MLSLRTDTKSNKECETIIAVGAIISEIPCIDKVDVSKIKTGDEVSIEDCTVSILKTS